MERRLVGWSSLVVASTPSGSPVGWNVLWGWGRPGTLLGPEGTGAVVSVVSGRSPALLGVGGRVGPLLRSNRPRGAAVLLLWGGGGGGRRRCGERVPLVA